MKPIFTVVKRNLASGLPALIIAALVVVLATTSSASTIALSRGNYTYLYLLLLPLWVVYFNFNKLVCLNASKKAYFWGSLLTYVLSAAGVSGLNTFIHGVIDPLNQTQTVINLMELCGWWQNGPLLAFLQQFAFLLLAAVFLHVLLFMQPYWYGWLTDGILVAVICVFVPIQPLRHTLAGFFKLIMFNASPLLHLSVCLCGCTALALVFLALLKRKIL